MPRKINIAVKASAKLERVEKIDEAHFRIWVKAPAAEGRANESVIRVLAEYFGIPKSRLELTQGFKSKNKVVQVS